MSTLVFLEHHGSTIQKGALGVLAKAARSRRAPVWLARSVLAEVEDLSTRIQASSRRLRDHA